MKKNSQRKRQIFPFLFVLAPQYIWCNDGYEESKIPAYAFRNEKIAFQVEKLKRNGLKKKEEKCSLGRKIFRNRRPFFHFAKFVFKINSDGNFLFTAPFYLHIVLSSFNIILSWIYSTTQPTMLVYHRNRMENGRIDVIRDSSINLQVCTLNLKPKCVSWTNMRDRKINHV